MQVSHSLLPNYSTLTVRFIRWNISLLFFLIEAANQPIAWQQLCILACRLGEVDLCRRRNWGRNGKFSTSTWIWVWSWMVLMGFCSAVPHSANSTMQWSDPTAPTNPTPVPRCRYGKHIHSHLRMKSLCLSRRQRLKVWFLFYFGTNGSLELFGTTHNLWVYVVVVVFMYNNSEGFCWKLRL